MTIIGINSITVIKDLQFMANLTIVDVPEHMSYVSTWLVLPILNIPRTRGMLGSSKCALSLCFDCHAIGLMIFRLICLTHNCGHTHSHTRRHILMGMPCVILITLHLLMLLFQFHCLLLYQCQVNHKRFCHFQSTTETDPNSFCL